MTAALVPLFPLPNVVLFPGAVLPLHVFEERYKRMTADVLAGDRRIAMALLRAGWEKAYYGRPAIEPVVCVGHILSHERLGDGRYNFLLQGERRARVVGEEGREGGYRVARVEPLAETNDDEASLAAQRGQLRELFARGGYATLPAAEPVRRMLAVEVPTAVIADVLAFQVLGEMPVAFRQSLLAEADVAARVSRTIEALAAMSPQWQNLPSDAGMN
jgi:Lon protease-like protein